jgi:DNA-binding XRE family transcriptional regulator
MGNWEGWTNAKQRAKDDPEKYQGLRKRLLSLRKSLGWTQSDLAEVLGCSKVTVARFEMAVGLWPRERLLEKIEKLEARFGKLSDIGHSRGRVRDGVDPK